MKPLCDDIYERVRHCVNDELKDELERKMYHEMMQYFGFDDNDGLVVEDWVDTFGLHLALMFEFKGWS